MNSDRSVQLIRGVNDSHGNAIIIRLDGDRIADCSPADGTSAMTEKGDLNLDGAWVALPGLAEPHAHVDKAYTAGLIDSPVGDLQVAVDSFESATLQGQITREDCEARAGRAFNQAIAMGCSAIRTHVDCGEATAFDHLDAVRSAQQTVAGQIEVQTVALIYQPIIGPGSTGNRDALARAVENGATVIGAAPQFADDPKATIDFLLSAAEEYNLPLDLHLDETTDPVAQDLEFLAQQVITRGFVLPVTASHCLSLGFREMPTQRRVASLVREAGISIVTLPQTNLLLQGRSESVAKPRGLTAIRSLLDAGVTVAAGSDNTEDPFNPLGRLDPIETASLLVSAGHVTLDEALVMITSAARMAMGLEPNELKPGCVANLTLIRGTDFRNAVARGGFERLSIRGGHILEPPKATSAWAVPRLR